jgi:hypothetical protein
MRIALTLLGASLGSLLGVAVPTRATDAVIVHEWGTFTCIQDDQGHSIGGINVDDEPVPYFVSSVAVGVAPQYGSFRTGNLGLPPYQADKAWISGDPRVTMRLETPVLYIYPPKGHAPTSVPPLDVHVDFHGGVLSQFYPHADFSGLPLLNFPEQPNMSGKFPYVDKKTGITEKTTTSLDWKGVQLGSTEKAIETDDKVWTTPRETSSPLLQVKFSDPDNQGIAKTFIQAEHFLFYRGVGHLDSPLRLEDWVRGEVGTTTHLRILRQNIDENETYPEAWLAEIHQDGTTAFQTVSSFGGQKRDVGTGVHPLATVDLTSSASFKSTDFSVDNLAKLKTSMQDALVKEGLYPDEASAMLRTWELSYFKSPGLRFFYIVPRAWVDKVLPLKVTGAPTNITRVMVGRIELVTDAQRTALARLSEGPCPDLSSLKKAARAALETSMLPKTELEAFYRGEKPLSELGITIPPLVQDYLSLGRFRDALVVHEQQEHPSAALAQFIKDNQLTPQAN